MSKLFRRSILVLAVLVAAAAAAWGQVKVMSSGGMQYLVNSQGMTLYYFTKDASGRSVCSGGCAKYWPPFHASNIQVSGGIRSSDFGSISRSDGSMQTTYKGWPLYTFAGDKKAGDMKGQGFRGTWFVATVPFYTVMDANTQAAGGTYLVDSSGRTLYYFTKDSAGKSVCSGGCAKLWPPFDASTIVVPSNLKRSDFSTIARSDGSKQVTYKGYPLYYFAHDQKRGEDSGNGFRNVWYIINPAKFDPPGSASSTSSTAVAKSSSGSGW